MFWKIFKRKQLPLLSKQGDFHDLEEIYHRVNARYFDQKLDLRITWFGKRTIPRTRILYGSYRHDRKEVRINRILDQEHVPQYVVAFILYHEMLHHVLPPKRGKNGRRRIHHKAFKEREREFEAYSEAKNFLSKFISFPV